MKNKKESKLNGKSVNKLDKMIDYWNKLEIKIRDTNWQK